MGYDFQERSYDENDVDTVQGKTVTTTGSNEAVVVVPATATQDDHEGDSRSLFVTPRVRFSSKDVADLFEFTYAPTFTYDEVDSSSDVGHDLKLLGERYLTRRWLVRATESYFYGEDSLTDTQRQSGAIIPASGEQPTATDDSANQEETGTSDLTDKYGRRQYWRNTFGLETEYTYSQDSMAGLGYNFGVLRNEGGGSGGYDDYDRHEVTGKVDHRFNTRWSTQTELAYVRGLYDPTEVTVVAPTTTATEEVDDDLVEYHGQMRLNYAWRQHDSFFGQYVYAAADYDAELREDSAIHEMTLGWDHGFSKQLHMTLSGGPTLITYDTSDNETGYNASAGLVWSSFQTSLGANTSYRYDYENFDGNRSGLSKIWRTQVQGAYRFTPQWQATLTGGYTQSDREEPFNDQVVAIVDDTAGTAADLTGQQDDHFRYREETWDAGLAVQYSFLRWYTASLSYRYADFQSEQDQDYDEHRIMLTLTAAKEILRW